MKAACCKCGRVLWESPDLREIIQAVEGATTHGAWEGGIRVAARENASGKLVRYGPVEGKFTVEIESTLLCPPCRGLTSWPVWP